MSVALTTNALGEVVSFAPELSVCVPVYKRPALLRRMLISVSASAKPFRVPIFIADDSCDETNRAVIEEAARDYPCIFWHRNTSNLGIDRNILRCVELSNCDYAWIFGEDDLMEAAAIGSVFELLKRTSYPFIFVNYASISNDYKRRGREVAIEITRDQVLTAAEFLSHYGWAAGFIGSCVVQKRRWDAVDKTRYVGTYYAHLGAIFEASRECDVYAFALPLVLNRAENAASFTWANDALSVVYGFGRLMSMLGEFYGPDVVREARRAGDGTFKSNSLIWLMSQRAEGRYDFAEWREFVLKDANSLFFRVCALFICFVPQKILSSIKRAMRR
jgi:glycosyltransferase involved in cell wall biosynthesis